MDVCNTKYSQIIKTHTKVYIHEQTITLYGITTNITGHAIILWWQT